MVTIFLRRYVFGIAITWGLLLLFMHGRLLAQYGENEKKAAEILTGNMLLIQCGNEVSVLRDKFCIRRFKWVVMNWIKDKCFGELGITPSYDIDCSVYQYLVFVERACPIPINVDALFATTIVSQEAIQHLLPKAPVVNNFNALNAQLDRCGKVCQWIKDRVKSAEKKWILHNFLRLNGSITLGTTNISVQGFKDGIISEKELNVTSITKKRRLKILLHMGLLTKEYGLNFGESALVGGPLGELVQWADLMSALHVLGHDVVLSWGPTTLRNVVLPHKHEIQKCQPARTVDLIFTDITGLEQLREAMGSLYHYRCLVRVLDVYGTDPMYNHPVYNPNKERARTWGGKGLDTAQFFTHFPHSPDNSFLGFVVEKFDGNVEKLKSSNTALLYGKRTNVLFGRRKRKYLDKIHDYYEDLHATMWSKETDDGDSEIPFYVTNHKNLKQENYLKLLRQSSIFVGLESPLEGPAALEAVANGAIFLNPKFIHRRKVADDKPTNRLLTSQNPYAETRIGEPYVYTVNIRNTSDVADVLKRIEKQLRPEPFVPHEFTYKGFLERVSEYIEKQDFCTESIRNAAGSPFIWKHLKERWPDLALLQIKVARFSESCVEACSRHSMACERSFFPEVNDVEAFNNVSQKCPNHRKVMPREEYEEHRNKKEVYEEFIVPCHAPSYNDLTEQCLVQTDQLLFSCACTPPSGIKRLCPCRRHRKEQTALPL